MKLFNTGGLVAATAFISFGLVACGGGPDIDKVREDFNNPSGKTSSQEGVMAVQGKQTATDPAMSMVSAVPGQGLSAHGKFQGLNQISMGRFEPRARQLNQMVLHGRQSQYQVGGEGCANSAEAEAAWEELSRDLVGDAVFGGGSASGSASYSIDLTSCSGGELTGSADVDIEVEVDQSRMVMTVSQTMDNVCETSGAEACISGEFIMEAVIENTGENAGRFEFITAWEFTGDWNDVDGDRRSASLEGGVRLNFAGNDEFGSASVEILHYITTPEGEEWSYVLSFSAEGNGETGSATLSIRGSDGTLECSWNSDGSGMCTGNTELAWTADDMAGLEAGWYEE